MMDPVALSLCRHVAAEVGVIPPRGEGVGGVGRDDLESIQP